MRHAGMIPGNLYPTADGYVHHCAGVLAKYTALYCYGPADLINTPLGANQSERYQHRVEIGCRNIGVTNKQENRGNWWTSSRKRMCRAQIAQLRRVVVCNDPSFLSRNMVIEVEQAISGKVKTPGFFIQVIQNTRKCRISGACPG